MYLVDSVTFFKELLLILAEISHFCVSDSSNFVMEERSD